MLLDLRFLWESAREAKLLLTGGGVAVYTTSKAASVVEAITGGGIAIVSMTGAHFAALSETGGGVAVETGRKGAYTVANLTGGGVVVLQLVKGVPVNVALAGGGIVTLRGEHGGFRVATETGGGVYTEDYTVSGTDRTVNLVLTGAGVVIITYSQVGALTFGVLENEGGRAPRQDSRPEELYATNQQALHLLV